MNRFELNLLGSSLSLAAMIAVAHPAQALMPVDIKGDTGPKMDTQLASPVLSQETTPQPAQSTETRIRQLAQANFGCTCTNCMNTVRQMIQQGQLSL